MRGSALQVEGPPPTEEAPRLSFDALLSESAEAPSSGTDSGRSTCCVDRSSELAQAVASQASPGSPVARVAVASARSGGPWALAGVLVQDAALGRDSARALGEALELVAVQGSGRAGQVPETVRVPDVG